MTSRTEPQALTEISGGCLCGASRYTASAPEFNVRACHCRLCQKATGAPFYARVQVQLDCVAITGPIGWYDSSPMLRRGFCTRCGTSLFSERRDLNMIGLTMGSLDDPDAFTPEVQIWTSSKQAWLKLDETLPHYPEAM